MLKYAALIVFVTLAACAPDPKTLIVGNPSKFVEEEKEVVAKLDANEQFVLRQLARAYKGMSASPEAIIPGTTTPWNAVNKMTVEQTLAVGRTLLAFRNAEAVHNQELAANAKRLQEEEVKRIAEERERTPRVVTAWPVGVSLYCSEISANQGGDRPAYGDWKTAADYRMEVFNGNVNFIPSPEIVGNVTNRSTGSAGGYVEFGGSVPHYSYFGNWDPVDKTEAGERIGFKQFMDQSRRSSAPLKDGRLSLRTNDNLHKDRSDWQAKFFVEMESGPLTLVKHVPVDQKPDLVEETYQFTLGGKDKDGPKIVTLECRVRRLSEEAIAAEEARTQAKAQTRANESQQTNNPIMVLSNAIDRLGNHPNPICSNGIEGPYGARSNLAEMIRAWGNGDENAKQQYLQPLRKRINQATASGCLN